MDSVFTNNTINGNGLSGSPLGVDTTIIATQHYVNNQGFITGNQTITLSGDVTGSGTTAITTTIADNAVTDAKFRQSAGLSVVGRSSNTTGNVADITAASDHQVLRRSGTSIGWGQVSLNQTNAVTGQLGVANGGTGAASLTGVLIGNGTSAISAIAAGAGNQILRRNVANTAYEWINTPVNTDNQTLTYTAATGDMSISGGNTQTIPLFSTSATTRGLTPGSNGATTSFLRGDGTWATPTASLSGGAANKVAFWTSASTLSNNTNFHWDNSNTRLGIGTSSPQTTLHVSGTARVTDLSGTPTGILGRTSTFNLAEYFTGANISASGGVLAFSQWFAQRSTNGSTTQSVSTSYSKLTIGTSGADFTSSGSGLTANPAGTGNDQTILVSETGTYEVSFCTCYSHEDETIRYQFLLHSALSGNTSVVTESRFFIDNGSTDPFSPCVSRTMILGLTANRYYSIRVRRIQGTVSTTFINPVFTIKRLI
jgi:hypothetical protein